MSVVSIGTGDTKSGRVKPALDVLSQAKKLPTALIGSFQLYQDLLSTCTASAGTARRSMAWWAILQGHRKKPGYLYARYDKIFTEADLLAAEAVTRQGFTLDNLELMDFLCECGAANAAEVVDLAHFDDE